MTPVSYTHLDVYKRQTPKRIVFGDPLYFEEFSGARLEQLVVDVQPPEAFGARVSNSFAFIDLYVSSYKSGRSTLKLLKNTLNEENSFSVPF